MLKSKKKKPQNTISLKDFHNLVDLEQQERQSSVGEGERTERGGSGTGNCWDQRFQRSVGSQRPNLPERLVDWKEGGRDGSVIYWPFTQWPFTKWPRTKWPWLENGQLENGHLQNGHGHKMATVRKWPCYKMDLV